MPMTFDTYSECSFRCSYCFAFFQKSVGEAGRFYRKTRARPVNVASMIKMLREKSGQFGPYLREGYAFQWGGMADPFDENEREQGHSLEILRVIREQEYPVSICTKSTWWADDPRYAELMQGAKHIQLKVSIITTDTDAAHKIEVLCPTPLERLGLIAKAARWGLGSVVLRLRPFIVGLSEKTAPVLIRLAAANGADAVSTEFMCLESRATKARARIDGMSKVLGFDVYRFYQEHTPNKTGYLRLNRELKRPYIDQMEAAANAAGIRFYVSDAHFKERCANGSCCGLPESWNYSRGQFTEALLIAKQKGRVQWADISAHLGYAKTFLWSHAENFNQASTESRAKFHDFTMYEWMRWQWNNVNGTHSPYKYFGGVLRPCGRDDEDNVIYEYAGEK